MKSTLKAAATLLAAAGLMSPAIAAPGQYEMRVLEGYASSKALLDGNYAKAMRLAEARRDSKLTVSRLANETTLCVALTKMGQLENAEKSCDKAVIEAQGMTPTSLTGLGMDKLQAKAFGELVEQNQAVIRALRASK